MYLSRSIQQYIWLATAAAVATIFLKLVAYKMTDSVGLLSDSLESGVNLMTAAAAWLSLSIATRPPDDQHMFGHSKAEYFSGGFTGIIILGAAAMVIYSAVQRWLEPMPLQQLGIGVGVSAVAAFLNFIVARILIKAGKQHDALALTAEGKHLYTDVWTTVGVVLGVTLVWLSGWLWIDIAIAIIIALQIGGTGVILLRDSLYGLMDTALSEADLAQITAVLAQYQNWGVGYHALRTRQAGSKKFVSLHLQVPGSWSVKYGHDVADEIEVQLGDLIPNLSVITHLEPLEDPRSWEDLELWQAHQPLSSQ